MGTHSLFDIYTTSLGTMAVVLQVYTYYGGCASGVCISGKMLYNTIMYIHKQNHGANVYTCICIIHIPLTMKFGRTKVWSISREISLTEQSLANFIHIASMQL